MWFVPSTLIKIENDLDRNAQSLSLHVSSISIVARLLVRPAFFDSDRFSLNPLLFKTFSFFRAVTITVNYEKNEGTGEKN